MKKSAMLLSQTLLHLACDSFMQILAHPFMHALPWAWVGNKVTAGSSPAMNGGPARSRCAIAAPDYAIVRTARWLHPGYRWLVDTSVVLDIATDDRDRRSGLCISWSTFRCD